MSQYNIILDVLGGYSRTLESVMRKLLGAKGQHVLSKMQKSVHSISPARLKQLREQKVVKEKEVPNERRHMARFASNVLEI